MPITLIYLATALAAYLLGSVPTGFLAAKAKGIDIRNVGSGNIGATNVLRVLGKPAGIFVLLTDALKGYAAAKWLPVLAISFFNSADSKLATFGIIAGIFAVLGHNYPCWLKFKGGKGIATTAGVFLALAPWAVLIAFAVFMLAVLLTKYVSVGSMAAAITLPAAIWILTPHNFLLASVATALGALAIYKHRGNIQRLMTGTENQLGKKKPRTEGTT